MITIVKEKTKVAPGKYINFYLDYPAQWVEMRIYDVGGRLVREMQLPAMTKGVHDVFWDGRNNLGERVAWNVLYFITIKADYGEVTTKFPYGRAWSCVEDIVRGGGSLEHAFDRCGIPQEYQDMGIGLEDCIMDTIKSGSSWQDAVNFCRMFQEPEPLPNGNEENGKDKEPEKKFPTWAIIAIAGVAGLLLLRGDAK